MTPVADLATDLATGAVVGALVTLPLVGVGFALGTLSVSGVAGAFVIGTGVWAGLGWRGYVVLLTFFLLSAGLTRVGWSRKVATGMAEERGGRRRARQALANGGVGVVAALMAGAGLFPELFAVAFAGAFAAAAADTAGTEVGQLLGRRTFLLTTFEPIPRGTDGGVSGPGTAAGALAALVVAGAGAAVGLYSLVGVAVAAGAGFFGSLVDSLLGATLERRGVLDNDLVNLLATASGAAIALVAAAGLL